MLAERPPLSHCAPKRGAAFFAVPSELGLEVCMRRSVGVERFGWWYGIAAVALISVGFFAVDEGGNTAPDGPIGTLVDEIVLKRGRIVVGSVLGMVGALLLLWFASALRIRLARDGGAGLLIGSAAFGSAVVMTAGGLHTLSCFGCKLMHYPEWMYPIWERFSREGGRDDQGSEQGRHRGRRPGTGQGVLDREDGLRGRPGRAVRGGALAR